MDERINAARERSIPELLRELSAEMATLVRQELALARAELSEKAKPAKESAGLFGITALFGLGAFLAATAFLIALLWLIVPLWAAALIVAAAYGIVAGVSAMSGRKKLGELDPQLLRKRKKALRRTFRGRATGSNPPGDSATRAQMGDTLEALDKTDVSARLQDAVTDRVETTYGILSDAAAQALDAAGAASSAASAAAADLTADVAQRVASGKPRIAPK